MGKKTKFDVTEAVKIIPIGGLNEIGKNMTLLEYRDQILIIDCGMSFPDDEMYGIDIVIPDFSYLMRNREKIVGMVLTHGHEDHIGAIPYLLKNINVKIYGTRLTLGLVNNKLKEHNIQGQLNIMEPGKIVEIGCFKVEPIRTTHSIADAVCLSIDTPSGIVFHSGDFKIDYTPVDGEPIDFSRLAELGKQGVSLMLCDSTNAVRPGFTASERVVGQTIENIFREAKERIIIATFSSNVHRVQRIIENAVKFNRKVAISGRSMENVVKLAIELNYLSIPAGTIVDLNTARNIPDDKLVIITTGSQGEPMSALSRIASGEHKAIKLKKGDMVIFSSTPIPGNEKTVSNVVNRLFEKGANVIYSDIADIHVSGHACQEELKLLHSLIRPKYFMPVHGEYRHLIQHANIAESLGLDNNNIFLLNNGDILYLSPNGAKQSRCQVDADAILVDGLGVGDVGNIVLRDRKALSESGLIIVVTAIDRASKRIISGPEIISRGFVYVRENEELMQGARVVAERAIEKALSNGSKDWAELKAVVRTELSEHIYKITKRSPIMLPIFLEV